LLLLAWVLYQRSVFERAPLESAAALATGALLVGPPATGHAVALPVMLFLLAGLSPSVKPAPP